MRHTTTFLLNGRPQRVAGITPTTTLLQWLRRSQSLTGCKEGCAEGGCGACTVLVGRWDGDRLRHHAINACMVLLPMLEATSVTTIEGVTGPDGTLHPCQQAMVACHASQCGFCTPGFVMSLLALYRATPSHQGLDAQRIDDALAGNLCRCTGYGPIVEAARQMLVTARPDWDSSRQHEEALHLAALQHDEPLEFDAGGRRMFVPATEDDLAAQYLAHPDATLIAGATDAALWVTKQTRDLAVSIWLGRVRDLQRMEVRSVNGAVRVWIGAGVSHADAMRHMEGTADLTEVWRRFAGAQVRNIATVGGNIANGSPIGDLAPALIALDATLHLRRGAERRALPLEQFFISYGRQDRRPGEFVTGVEVLAAESDLQMLRCCKVSKRFDDDISAVSGAFNIAVAGGFIQRARIAFGGMAGTPRRAHAVEAALTGKPWTRATVATAMPAFTVDFAPLSDARASADYRMRVAKNLLLRCYVERAEPTVATRIAGSDVLLAIG